MKGEGVEGGGGWRGRGLSPALWSFPEPIDYREVRLAALHRGRGCHKTLKMAWMTPKSTQQQHTQFSRIRTRLRNYNVFLYVHT